jgi:hypothetical protein
MNRNEGHPDAPVTCTVEQPVERAAGLERLHERGRWHLHGFPRNLGDDRERVETPAR